MYSQFLDRKICTVIIFLNKRSQRSRRLPLLKWLVIHFKKLILSNYSSFNFLKSIKGKGKKCQLFPTINVTREDEIFGIDGHDLSKWNLRFIWGEFHLPQLFPFFKTTTRVPQPHKPEFVKIRKTRHIKHKLVT